MSRYIDADALIEELHSSFFGNRPREVVDGIINAQPTADVIEVVRCKDCIHHKPFPFSDEHICDVFDWKSEDKDFCSFAERRKNEQIH